MKIHNRSPTIKISIHALREEGDSMLSNVISWDSNFYPRPPRGGRLVIQPFGQTLEDFYPRPPRGGRRHHEDVASPPAEISIHALREEGDLDEKTIEKVLHISIHALREEGDGRSEPVYSIMGISIHALREEGDRHDFVTEANEKYFYPRPPRGGRREGGFCPGDHCKFLSTPSARRATAKTETKSLFSYKLYNILHEFRRALIYNGSKNYPNHAK